MAPQGQYSLLFVSYAAVTQPYSAVTQECLRLIGAYIITMGASPDKQSSKPMPKQGSRVLQVLNPELQGKLQPFTDYIIEPPPQTLKNSLGQIRATVFSTLDYSLRKQVLPVSENRLGARIKVAAITDCALKVTKVFPHSPCERLGIHPEEYIVGLMESEFKNLSTFAQALHSIIAAKREVFTLAICSQQGVTRLVPVPVALLSEWKAQNQGTIGCELAEGWMHRFKGRPKRGAPDKKEKYQEAEKNLQKESELRAKEEEKEIGKVQEEGEEGEEEWEEIERKVGGQAMGESIEVVFKGLLKNECLEDASTICRCKIYDKHCERCWIERDGGYHFYNRKTSRIVAIPGNLLLRVSE